jgi:hypothetical protein
MEESPKNEKKLGPAEVAPRKRRVITEKQAAARIAQAVIVDLVRAELGKEWVATSDYPKYMVIGRMLAKALREAKGDTDEKRRVSAVLDKAASLNCQEPAMERILSRMYQDKALSEASAEGKARIREMEKFVIEAWKARCTTKDAKDAKDSVLAAIKQMAQIGTGAGGRGAGARGAG